MGTDPIEICLNPENPAWTEDWKCNNPDPSISLERHVGGDKWEKVAVKTNRTGNGASVTLKDPTPGVYQVVVHYNVKKVKATKLPFNIMKDLFPSTEVAREGTVYGFTIEGPAYWKLILGGVVSFGVIGYIWG